MHIPTPRRAAAAGLAAAALAAGLVGTAAPALAGPAERLTLTPESTRAASGTCVRFLVRALDAARQPAAGAVLEAHLTESADAAHQQDADFCTTAAAGQVVPSAPTEPAAVDDGRGSVDRARYTTGADGTVSLGIVTTLPGNTVTLRVFADRNGDRLYTAGEPTATASLATSAGARPGQPNSAPDAVAVVDVGPDGQRVLAGDTVAVQVRVRNAAGDTVPGVTPSAAVTAGANTGAAVTCGVTDNAGRTTCTYTATRSTAAASDTVLVWVNQSRGTSPRRDSGEPAGDALVTVQAPPRGLQVDLVCATAGPQDKGPEECVTTTSTPTRTFTARVTAPDGTDRDTARDPAPHGTLVRFTLSGSPTASLSVVDCATEKGLCTTRVTERSPRVGTVVTVTATVRGQDPAGDPNDGEVTSDTGTLSFTNTPADARTISLAPDGAVTPAGGVRELVATVLDADGGPVRGVTVTFVETGAGRFVNATSTAQVVTGADGTARAEVTSQPAETGEQTVTATITSPRNPGAADDACEAAAGRAADGSAKAGAPAGRCTVGVQHVFGATGTPPQGQVTLQVSSARVTAGNTPMLSGVARDGQGVPVKRAQVTIHARGWGQDAYTPLTFTRPVVTDDEGRFSALVRPYRQTGYVAQVADVKSPARVVAVHSRVNVSAPVAGARVAAGTVFTGDLDPDFAGVEVGLARIGRTADGRPTFAVIGVARTDGTGAYRVAARGGLPRGTGAYVVFTSAHQGSDKGAKSLTLHVG